MEQTSRDVGGNTNCTCLKRLIGWVIGYGCAHAASKSAACCVAAFFSAVQLTLRYVTASRMIFRIESCMIVHDGTGGFRHHVSCCKGLLLGINS
jgi:hypothetical protein